jgi:uncharacterized membrane protein YfcA
LAVTVEVAVLLVVAGILVGILSSLFGVGGGVLMVPFLVLALGRAQHVAEGTSLLVMVPTAALGVWAHRRRGYVVFRQAVMLAIGGIAGASVGALLALQLPASTLRTLFGILLALTGMHVIRRGMATLRAERRDHPSR